MTFPEKDEGLEGVKEKPLDETEKMIKKIRHKR